MNIESNKEKTIDFVDEIKTEAKLLRKDFDLAREELKEKAGVEYLEKFNERLTVVEKHLKLTTV